MPAKTDPRNETDSAGSPFYYRRSLSAGELLPAIGIGVAAGLVAFYLAQVVMQRTPLVRERATSRRLGRRGSLAATAVDAVAFRWNHVPNIRPRDGLRRRCCSAPARAGADRRHLVRPRRRARGPIAEVRGQHDVQERRAVDPRGDDAVVVHAPLLRLVLPRRLGAMPARRRPRAGRREPQRRSTRSTASTRPRSTPSSRR